MDALDNKRKTETPKRKTTPRSNTTITPTENKNYKVSKNAIERNILYGAKDSTWVDVKNKLIYLFGESYMEYDGYVLKADQIRLDFENDLAFAEYRKGKNGKKIGIPYFEYQEQKLSADNLKFNYKTKKGLVQGSKMTQGEFSILGGTTKFISKDSPHSIEDLIFQKNAVITTCTHDHPHYGIRTKKIKIIPNKVAVIGFSQLEIAGVPTPLFLPYGLFPLVEGGQTAGLIFPKNYEYDNEYGFGLRRIGYYFPINDYMDLTLTGNIYTRGTHMITVSSNYKKRYKYNGNFAISYNNNLRENTLTGKIQSNKAFRLNLRHNQDAKAHPYRKFGGAIDIQTNGYQQTNFNDYSSQVRNKLSSNFSYSDNMPGTPFNLVVKMSHFQDTQTHSMNVTLPSVALRMQTLQPFKKSTSSGANASWYERINVSYDADLQNYVKTVDSTFLSRETLDKVVTGARQNASLSANFKVKYFDISPNLRASQIFTYKTRNKYLSVTKDSTEVIDQNGQTSYLVTDKYKVEDDFNTGIKVYNGWQGGVRVSTNVYGTKRWNKGWLRGVRHTISPSVNFNYQNGTKQYEREYYTSLDSLENQLRTYSIFEGGAYNPSIREEQLGLNYSISNAFQMKYYSKKDEKEKMFSPLKTLVISGNYNSLRDSIQWSPVSFYTNTTFFSGITTIGARGSYNIYKKNKNGQFINKTVWAEDKKLLEFNNFTLNINNSFTVDRFLKLFSKDPTPEDRKDRQGTNDVERIVNDKADLYTETGEPLNTDELKTMERGDQRTFYDYIKDFSIYHRWSYDIRRNNQGDLERKSNTHTIGLSGRIPLTDNWNVAVRNISYDLVRKSFVYPSIGLERDLHCWNMSFDWYPSRDVYSFYISVKSTNLSFLKYNYGNQTSGSYRGRFP